MFGLRNSDRIVERWRKGTLPSICKLRIPKSLSLSAIRSSVDFQAVKTMLRDVRDSGLGCNPIGCAHLFAVGSTPELWIFATTAVSFEETMSTHWVEPGKGRPARYGSGDFDV